MDVKDVVLMINEVRREERRRVIRMMTALLRVRPYQIQNHGLGESVDRVLLTMQNEYLFQIGSMFDEED